MDNLLYHASTTARARALGLWFDSFDHGCLTPEFHRVQIERWLYDELHGFDGRVIDIAQDEAPRQWLEISDYQTLAPRPEADIEGDMLELDASVDSESVDAFICTEVLEHCKNPIAACNNMYYALKPMGRLYACAPFCWPDHRQVDYDDYWRFTEQAYQKILMPQFFSVEITPIEWTDEGKLLYDLMRRFECMGISSEENPNGVTMHTGYLVKATK